MVQVERVRLVQGPSPVLGNLKVKPHSSVILDHKGSDDAAVVRLSNGTLIIQTVDFLHPLWMTRINLVKLLQQMHYPIFMLWEENHCLH